ATLADLLNRFGGRHRNLEGIFARHFDVVASRIGSGRAVSGERRQLIGAYFTHEESPEGAALTNPSVVAHPDQDGLQPGELRFVLSLRAIGEGHVSGIEFRTGVIGADRAIRIDRPSGFLTKARTRPTRYVRGLFEAQLEGLGPLGETSHQILEALGPAFDRAELDGALSGLDRHALSRNPTRAMVERFGWVAANNYEVAFAEDSTIDERVLLPVGPTERHGMEDARFVRFLDEDGTATYLATYTAYDGAQLGPQLLATDDFRNFRVRQLSGPSARNKGMAIFPRRIRGQFVSLSRWDRESNSLAVSDDLSTWGPPTPVQLPHQPWELIQIGNCGSPIETPAGWLLLTHGVGPMRTYSIGATLLDSADPTRLIGSLTEPLLVPAPDEQDGYVPNVVYTCGGLAHGDTLLLPYGFGDRAVGFATVDIPELLRRILDR
ncbi:MAG TPA: glycoside hydrolase family 130 protein, partial [Acidimicrobiia bacterium]|nr:glycoside hydrolase family 130 protein [Acidimicrobiia bacterium]